VADAWDDGDDSPTKRGLAGDRDPDGVHIPTAVRTAATQDLSRLAGIEAAADGMFADFFGYDPGWGAPTSGEWRAAQPGFLLVATEGEEVIGFAHVLEREGHAHLEQLAVRPDRGRRGAGTALVRAVLGEAAARGHAEVTLCTYADVPWNAPFYRRLGFTEVTELAPHLQRIRDRELRLDLERHGRRVVMAAPTR
jgi:ribosomal protein S18 acetylase RimI-like enzyme